MSKLLAYLAGVVDSDGCITIKRRRVKTAAEWNMQPCVFVRQVTNEAIEELHETFGGRVRIHPPSTTGGRPLFHWDIERRLAVDCAKRLLPYLRIKKRQAQIAIEFGEFLSNPRLRCLVTYFHWSEDEPCYTVKEASELKGTPPCIIYQAISNNSIPSMLLKGKGRGTRLIPKRFWDKYTPSLCKRLPQEYLDARDEFRARIHSLNGPTKGVPTLSR